MATVNLYDVLNISQDATKQEIKDAYKKLAKQFHPDKAGGDSEMFELVTHAYNVLLNSNSREEYDKLYKLAKQSETDHFDLKTKSKSYSAAQETNVVKKSKEETEKEFNKIFDELDRKHGFDRSSDNIRQINPKEISKRLDDYKMIREQEDIENIHEKLFDERRPLDLNSLAKFNAAFEAMHKGPTELIKHTGNPDAWSPGDQNFSSIVDDKSYENLYVEDNDIGNSMYGSVKLDNSKKRKLTKEDIEKIKEAEYTKNHNADKKEFDKIIKERMRERELDTHKFDEREYKDFEKDGSSATGAFGGYGIFDKLGIDKINSLTWDDDSDIKLKYKKMLDSRKLK